MLKRLLIITFIQLTLLHFNTFFGARSFQELLELTLLRKNDSFSMKKIFNLKNAEAKEYETTKDEQALLNRDYLEFFQLELDGELDAYTKFVRQIDLLINIRKITKNKDLERYQIATLLLTLKAKSISTSFVSSQFENLLKAQTIGSNSNLYALIYLEYGSFLLEQNQYRKVKNFIHEGRKLIEPNSLKLQLNFLLLEAELYLKEHDDERFQMILKKFNEKIKGNENQHFTELNLADFLVTVFNCEKGNWNDANLKFYAIFQNQIKNSCHPEKLIETAKWIGLSSLKTDNYKFFNEFYSSLYFSKIDANVTFTIKRILLRTSIDEGVQGRVNISLSEFFKAEDEYDQIRLAKSRYLHKLILEESNATGQKYSQLSKNRTVILSLVFVCVLSLSLLGYIYFFQLVKQQKKSIQLKHELERESEKKENLLNQLSALTQDLNTIQLNLKTRHEHEENLVKMIREFKKRPDTSVEHLLHEIQFRLSTLLEMDDTSNESEKITKSDDEFITNLKEKHPDLTDQEITLCSLVKLKLNSKEIGTLMGISAGSVRVYKTKLKQKLGLSQHQSFWEYINQFGNN